MKTFPMKYLHLYLTSFAFVFELTFSQEFQQPEKFHAIGEIVYPILGAALTQTYFEEFHAETRAEFLLIGSLVNSTFLQDVKQEKTWRITEDGCVTYTARDWEAEHIPPDLRVYETENENSVFPIRQLFKLRESNSAQKPTKTDVIFRDIPCNQYDFRVDSGDKSKYTEIQAFWSNGSMESMSSKKSVPVGFKITSYSEGKAIKHQYINIHMFFEGEETFKKVEPTRGIYCPNVTKSTMMIDKIKGLTTFSYSSELVSTDDLLIKDIDVWLVPNKLARHDYSVDDTTQVPTRITRITSMNQGDGTVYEISRRHFTKPKCELKKMKDVKFDSQIIIPEEKATSVTEFFGFSSTSYHAIGTIQEYGIRCRLYHGLRTDWPPDRKDITTLWEWCIVNMDDKQLKFDEEHFPLISLNIYITKSPDNITTGFYYQGRQFSHHFYNIHNYATKQVETNYFDISECFNTDQKMALQFSVEVSEQIFNVLKEEIKSIGLISAWRDALFKATTFSDVSLRISKPTLDFLSFNSTYNMMVRFTLMDRHPNIPEAVEPVDLKQGVSKVRSAVNNNDLQITYKNFNLRAKPGSLLIVKEIKIAEDDESDGSGYTAATMAGVAIVMLLIGAAIGVAAIFIKKKYFDKR